MIKRSIHQEDLTILKIYATTNAASKYLKQTPIELEGEIDRSTIIVRGFNTPLLKNNRTSKQEVDKGTEDFSNTVK